MQILEQLGHHMGSARCDVNTRSGTSGSLIYCSSFYFRDVQGLKRVQSPCLDVSPILPLKSSSTAHE